MCYWYADSTFEVLADMGNAKQELLWAAKNKGVLRSWKIKWTVYTGITRMSVARSTPAGTSDCLEEESYGNELSRLERAGVTYDITADGKSGRGLDIAERRRRKAEREGWTAKFLERIKEMPDHQTLLNESKARAITVREELKTVCRPSRTEEPLLSCIAGPGMNYPCTNNYIFG